jgi:AcrR family transcriptional regulator
MLTLQLAFALVKGFCVAEPVSRRDRIRAATITEIKDTARAILVSEGPAGLTLRAIAREMGMSAPALYRYFQSREELLQDLVTDLYAEVSTAMETARDAEPADAAPARLRAVSRAFRAWATSHPAEFALVFGSRRLPSPTEEPGGHSRFGGVFGGLIAQIYRAKPFPIPADDEISPELRAQLAEFGAKLPVPLPDGVTQVFLSCWIRLYGIVSMEVFGQLGFALDDVEPMFEAELRGLGVLLGIAEDYRPPAVSGKSPAQDA